MIIADDGASVQKWHELILEMSEDKQLVEQFLAEPSAMLAAKGIINSSQIVEIKPCNPSGDAFYVLIYHGTAVEGQPVCLVVKATELMKSHSQKLQKFALTRPGTC